MNNENVKKIGLMGCIFAGIGCIVGSGIFGSLPEIINNIGAGVIWALLGATFVVILRSISKMYTVAAVPTSAANFMHSTKLIHPYAGVFQSINGLLIPSMIALFSVLFATYFLTLFPGCPLSGTVISVLMILGFTFLAWFGNRTTVTVNNLMVLALLAAIGLYIFVGLPNIQTDSISFADIIKPGIGLSGLGAAVGILTSSLSGASAVCEIADDVKKPGKNLPITLCICPIVVCVIYILMALITIATVPDAKLESLAQVAQHFLSPTLLTFFVVGGPIVGILTSMIPVALSNVAVLEFSAKNQVYPQILAKKNRYGVSYWSLLLVSAIAIGITATGATFGVIMTVFSFSNTLSELPNTIMPFFVHKKYPNCAEKSSVRIPYGLMKILAVITFVICVYLCIEMVKTLNVGVWITLATIYVGGYIYFFLRVNYLKKARGVDLIEELKVPFAPWEEKEKMLGAE